MTVNNFESMPDMFSTHYELICFFVKNSYYFVTYLLGFFLLLIKCF